MQVLHRLRKQQERQVGLSKTTPKATGPESPRLARIRHAARFGRCVAQPKPDFIDNLNSGACGGRHMGGSYRIVVADSDPAGRAFLRLLVEQLGHHVLEEATDQAELRAVISARPPDLVVASIQFIAAAEFFSAKHCIGDIQPPIVIIATDVNDELLDRAVQSCAMAIVSQQGDLRSLDAAFAIAIQRSLDLTAMQQELSATRRALDDRKLIERAKGILMSKRRLDEPAAFSFLQKLARSNRQKLIEVARSVIVAEEVFLDEVTTGA